MAPRPIVGQSVPRKEGRGKVTGQARYVDDLAFPGLLHGVTVRSAVPRGRIRKISFEGDVPWDEIVVVTAKDIPGENRVAVILHDQPFLADGAVNHAEEPILLLAHADRHVLEEARRSVRVEIEPLPPVLTIEDSLAKKEIVWGEDNVLKSFLVEKGDVERAFAEAEVVVEGEYTTGAQEHLYIEPNGMIAIADPTDGVTVFGSLQCPYFVHKGILPLFGLPPEKVRVVQVETGGAFGGKEDYPSVLAGHAALLAWKSGRPVKIVYDRAEDMAATTKRHPSRTRHRAAATRDGKLLAMDIDFVLDGGAYATISSVVLSRGTIHAAGPYCCPNVRIRSRAVATNTPPHGAFRGFGAPQSLFALERQMDRLAERLGLEPDEFRRRNFVREGETLATGQVMREKVDLGALLDRALAESDYHAKRARFAEENRRSPVKKGMGIATFMHGAGFTGSGEKFLAAEAGVEATAEGRVRILVASTEMGQGAHTTLAQIVAGALGLDHERVEVAQPDTAVVPNSGPTVASRTCMIVGKLLESAALGLKQTLVGAGLLREPYTQAEFEAAAAAHVRAHGSLKSYARYEQPPHIHWDDEKYRGDAYGAYAWAAYVAEVSVDTVTYETRVDDFVAVQEVGKVVNPVIAAGQIEGGVGQAIGFALYENVIWDGGRMVNSQLTNYSIPTVADVPPIRVFFEEVPYAYGPSGAKGIGELPHDGPAPAILNAVASAVGASGLASIPLLPEALMAAIEGHGGA